MRMSGAFVGHEAARPLSNIPLIWMMENAERHGLCLLAAWRERLHIKAKAPSGGMSRGWR